MKKLMVLVLTCLTSGILTAQSAEPEMADLMRSEGKIYVVVAIILIILGGIFGYLFYLERRISRIENNSQKKG
ncbi:MAG: CcmD family protein [Cyclobacteriaceae bacterium]